MVIPSGSSHEIRRWHLPALQADNHIGSQTVHHVSKISLILADVAAQQVGAPVVLLAAIEVECQPRRDWKTYLRPSAAAAHRNPFPARQDIETRTQRAQRGHVPAMEEHARKLQFFEWPEKPVHRIHIGG